MAQKRLAYQETIQWAYYWSNVTHTRIGDMIQSQVWCFYYDATDTKVGEFHCEPTMVKFNPDNHDDILDGKSETGEQCYRFTSA